MEFDTKFLYLYYDKRSREFKRQFQLARGEFTQKPIHHLRVSLKKIRALFRLIEYLDPDFSQKENFRTLRKIFKEAGLIRNIQVQTDLMSRFNQPGDRRFRAYLDDLAIEAKIRFSENLAGVDPQILHPISQEVQAAVTRIPCDGLTDRVSDFILDKIRSTTGHFHNGNGQDRMHRSRIFLKDAYYMLQMIHGFDVRSESVAPLLDRMNQLQSVFGTWHDWEQALYHFDAYLVHRRH